MNGESQKKENRIIPAATDGRAESLHTQVAQIHWRCQPLNPLELVTRLLLPNGQTMPRQARGEYLNPGEVQVIHAVQRCVRRA